MKSILDFLKRTFELSLGEAKSVLFGMAALLVLLLINIISEKVTNMADRQFKLSAYYQPEEELNMLNQEKEKLITLQREEKKSAQFKLFNPNKVSVEDLTGMGFPKYGANNLVKFRNAGKTYKFKEDLAKVYGISEEFLERISPFIDLPSKTEQAVSTYETVYQGYPENEVEKVNPKPLTIEKFDINLATLPELTKVYGIGKVFAQRIIKYRESLGGFYELEQVKKTYGLPDSTYLELLSHVYLKAEPRKIKINEVELGDWKTGPLSYSKKKGILAYRKQHGHFENAEQLKKLHILSEDDLLSAIPYLDFSIPHE